MLSKYICDASGEETSSSPTPRQRGVTRPYRLLLDAAGRWANMLAGGLAAAPDRMFACEGCRNACN